MRAVSPASVARERRRATKTARRSTTTHGTTIRPLLLLRLKLRIAGLPESEAPRVGTGQFALPHRAHAVACVEIQAQQHRLAARRRRLQARDELGRYPGSDAWIVDAGVYERGRILHAVLDVGVGAHRIQRAETGLGLDAAEFGGIAGAIGGRFETQRVGNWKYH